MKTREQFKRFKANDNTGMVLFADSARGVYIPQNWLESIDPEYWNEITPWARECIEAGPEHDDYWNAWEQLCDDQFCIDTQGREWTLYQDGDLWVICIEAMTGEEKANFGFDQD